MRTITCTIKVIDGRAWASLSWSRAPGEARVPEVVRWMIEQFHLGNFHDTLDNEGRLVSLVLGAAAAPPIDDADFAAVAERVKERALAVNIAGLMAAAREEGIEPAHHKLADLIRDNLEPGGRDNTSFHYALELTDVLERISRVSFAFDSPAIKTRAAPGVIKLLKEATRAYLFGLSRSCLCVCRALLEAALRDGVSDRDLMQERVATKKGELECLISIAAKRGRLPAGLTTRAHAIRRAGNRALHGTKPNDNAAWELLQDTRSIISALYAAA